ncbi:hypothetical protein ACFSF0_13495 [Ottowia flava]|uniref:Thioredoxin-like fold domain-containing protein n=1 Tax=Ottowia flava TaxID=2675430 RepID=A0ABW4KWV1_9BURK|nr:hypothetical protein [Ottowia sp. GY511]
MTHWPPSLLPAWPRRRALSAAVALVGVWAAGADGPARAATRTLPLSKSLPDELNRALKAGQPLVVMVSLHRCPWCEEVRNNYLGPMHAEQALPVVQVDMRGTQRTVDAQGRATGHDALVKAWAVKVAPTVLFLGPGGREVADRLVGGSTDFYAAYLDRRLEQARKALAG